MASTGLLLLEVCLSMDKEANIVSMAEKTLGKFGKYSAWCVYIFFFYTLTIAYISGGQQLFYEWFGGWVPSWLTVFIFVSIFAPFIYLGAKAVEGINVLLIIGLVLSYLIFVILGIPEIESKRLLFADVRLSFVAFPVIFTSFGFQGIIPSLTFYLKRNAKMIRLVIIVGSIIPFIIYVIWQWLILGSIPREGTDGLLSALEQGQTAIQPLKLFLGSKLVTVVGQSFAFFALTSSLLGVTLGLRDFLADGLKVKKDLSGKLGLCFLIFVPPLLFTLLYPNLFIKALDLAGGFGCAYLLGVLPIMMAWSGRYIYKYSTPYQFLKGKLVLALLALFVLFEIGLEIYYVCFDKPF